MVYGIGLEAKMATLGFRTY